MKRIELVFVVAVTLLAGCASDDTSSSGGGSVTLLTHDSFLVSDGIFSDFETANNVKVVVAKGADAGVTLNQAILSKGKPEGDVLWGVDNTLSSRAVTEGVVEPYKSAALATLDPSIAAFVPSGNELTPIDRGDVCVNADKAWFEAKGLAMPTSFADLADAKYKDLLVVENAATSSPGLAFMLATRAEFGEAGWLGFWKQLRDNGVKVVDGWTQAYTVDFSGSSGKGPRPLVVSYGSSPAAEAGPTVGVARDLFRPGRIRRRAQGNETCGASGKAHRLHALGQVPG